MIKWLIIGKDIFWEKKRDGEFVLDIKAHFKTTKDQGKTKSNPEADLL